jgi:hypothetical protein
MPRAFFHRTVKTGFVLLWVLLISACQPGAISTVAAPSATPTPIPDDPTPLEFQGAGTDQIQFSPWSGPAVLHIVAGQANTVLQVTISMGLDRRELVNAQPPLDEYRGFEFSSGGKAELDVQSDGPWSITVLPVSPRYFHNLKIPGNYSGKGGAVLIMDGDYGVATFDTQDYQDLTAWAFGPGGVGEQLSIHAQGDYQGKSVLPRGAGWIIVSARGSWSVKIQAPCCQEPPGL